MKLHLKQTISTNDFKHYTAAQLREKVKAKLVKDAMMSILNYQIVKMQETTKETTFSLEMIVFTPHQWKGIVSVLNDIKLAMEKDKDIKPLLVNLCNALRG